MSYQGAILIIFMSYHFFNFFIFFFHCFQFSNQLDTLTLLCFLSMMIQDYLMTVEVTTNLKHVVT